jgi:hypothetical protein
MAENLKKILNIDGTDYNINAVYSDEAGKVTNPLIVKESGNSAFSFDGSTSGQTIDYVPTEGGTYSGKVYIKHANALEKDLTTVADDELINCDQIRHLVSAVIQHPLYSLENKQLAHLKNVQGGLSGLNVVVGTTDEFNTFKRVMGVPKLSYETSSSELYYGLSLNNNGTGKCLVGSYNKNSTYTDVFIPSVGYPSFDSATKTIYLADKRTLTCIGAEAFKGNTKITKVSIPESVTEIKYNAFDGCTALKSIILPSKLAYISGFTFRNCSSLESIAIGANVTADNVESSAFNGCTSLNKVYYAGTEDAWNAIIAKIKEDYPSNDGTARLETITNNKNVIFNYQYTPEFIDLPCLYICTDLGTDGLNIDNVNKMFLKMPNTGIFVELSRSATYLESPVGATTSGYYTYETLAAIIAGINSRLTALGSDALALPDTLKVSSAEHTIVPELPDEIITTNDKVIVAENVVPSVQELNAKIDSIELTEAKVKLAEDLYTYVPIGNAQKASNEVIGSGSTISATNRGKLGSGPKYDDDGNLISAGDSLKSVFNKIFGTQTDTQPSVVNSNVRLNVSTGTTSYGSSTTEYGTPINANEVTITFTLANSGTANYGYRCGNTKTTGSQTFYYPVTKQSTGSTESGKTSADIKITLPYAISKVEDATVSSVAYKKLTTVNGNSDTITILTPTATYVSYSSKYIYCNFNSSKQVSVKVSLPAGSVTTSLQTRYEQISASVTLGAAQKEDQLTAGTAITAFLTFLKADPDPKTTAGAKAIAALSGEPKSNTAGAYTIAAGKYYNYYLASTSTSLSNDTSAPVTTATQFSSSTISIPCTDASHIWFLLPPDTSGSKSIQYEPFANTWVDAFGGAADTTVGPVDVALALDSGTDESPVVVTYKGYYTSAKAAAGSSLNYKIV